MQKTLTNIPMGQIKDFISKNFDDIQYTETAKEFFENEFLGNINQVSSITKLKDGIPMDVVQWLKDEFNINMNLQGDYAIAVVLAILLEFKNRAFFDTFEKDGVEYGSAYHKNCMQHSCIDKSGNSIDIYELNVTNSDFKLFVSKNNVDFSCFEKSNKIKNRLLNQKKIHLTVPLAKFEEETDLSETFRGSSMIKKENQQEFKISSAKAITMLDLGLDKVEIKQVAAVCMVYASCSPVDTTPQICIDDDFYIYVQYKDSLAFASKIEKENFIQGDALEKMKVEEDKTEKSQDKFNSLNPLGLF